MPDSVQTLASTTISISATLPTTFDDDASTGYPSVSYTAIGEVVDFGEFGSQYNLVTHLPIASRQIQKYKGSYNNGTVNVNMARDDDDAGQVIALAALASDNNYSFKITYQDSTDDYFAGKVMSFNAGGGNSDTIVMRSMQIEISEAIVTTA